MFNFFKKKKLPDWTRLSTVDRLEYFLNLVEDYFKSIDQAIQIEDGEVFLIKNGQRSESAFGLTNLSIECEATPKKEWPSLVSEHFKHMQVYQKELDTLAENRMDFRKVSHQLMLSLADKNNFSAEELGKLIYQEDVPGLLTCVMFGLTYGLRSVSPEDLSGWGKDREEIFSLAMEQTEKSFKKFAAPELRDLENEFGVQIYDFVREYYSVESVLHPEKIEENLGRSGAFVSFPNHFRTLICPIQNTLDASQLHIFRFIAATHASFVQHQAPLSNNVYWYNQKTFTLIPWKVNKNDNVDLEWPEAFLKNNDARSFKG